MRKKFFAARRVYWMALLVAAMLLSGCGGSGANSHGTAASGLPTPMATLPSASMPAIDAAAPPRDDAEANYGAPGEDSYGGAAEGSYGAEGAGTAITPPSDGRRVIMTAQVSMETLEFDETLAALQKAVSDAGGHTYASSISGDAAYYTRNASFTYKIPPAGYAGFMQGPGGAGTVLSRDEQSEDVTSQYVDIDARVEALEVEADSLLNLMEQAARLDDLITLQDRLSDVQAEINYYAGMRRQLDSQTEYCTVDVDVSEVIAITEPPPPEEPSYGEKIAHAFGESWRIAGDFFMGAGLVIVWALPLLALAALAAAAALIAVNRVKKYRAAHPNPVPPSPAGPPPFFPHARPHTPYPPYPAPLLGPPAPIPAQDAAADGAKQPAGGKATSEEP